MLSYSEYFIYVYTALNIDSICVGYIDNFTCYFNSTRFKSEASSANLVINILAYYDHINFAVYYTLGGLSCSCKSLAGVRIAPKDYF